MSETVGASVAGAPMTTRTTFARPGASRPPAPIPTAATSIDGIGPHTSVRARRSAIPVGVASSPSPPASTRQPRASSSTAGTGTGSYEYTLTMSNGTQTRFSGNYTPGAPLTLPTGS